jgi:hypothetical protein
MNRSHTSLATVTGHDATANKGPHPRRQRILAGAQHLQGDGLDKANRPTGMDRQQRVGDRLLEGQSAIAEQVLDGSDIEYR